MAVLQRRINSSDSGALAPVDIAGFCIAGAIILGLVAWAFVTFTRRRARAKNMNNGVSPHVGRLVKEGMPSHSEKTLANIQIGFCRQQTNDCVTLPAKVLQRSSKLYTSNNVIEYHRQSRMSHKPFSFVLSATPSPDQAHLSANIHESILNLSANKSRFSAFSISSSVDSSPTTGTAHKVKRAFDPVHSDELSIRVGEPLTLVQSFDDGWCLVGREHSSLVATPKCPFGPNTITGDGIEFGVVPAWSFIRPVPGLHAERPTRSNSLGITVQSNAHEAVPRNNIISWSNF